LGNLRTAIYRASAATSMGDTQATLVGTFLAPIDFAQVATTMLFAQTLAFRNAIAVGLTAAGTTSMMLTEATGLCSGRTTIFSAALAPSMSDAEPSKESVLGAIFVLTTAMSARCGGGR
jgi:hypothetical protein